MTLLTYTDQSVVRTETEAGEPQGEAVEAGAWETELAQCEHKIREIEFRLG